MRFVVRPALIAWGEVQRRDSGKLAFRRACRIGIQGMATSTVAGAKSEGTPAKPRWPNRPPRPLIRLMRYVVPYGWPLLASVGLMRW